MARIIATANQKGGVGKTSTAVNIAASFGLLDKKTLLVDCDPQGNSTTALGINKRSIEKGIYDVLIESVPAEEAIISTGFKNLDILPTDISLAGAALELADMDNRAMRLKQAVLPVSDRYDYIIIDCPPSLGLLTVNALSASSGVLIPIQCEFFALEGLSQLMNTLRQIKRKYNSSIEIEGVLLTMYDARLNLTLQVLAEVKKYFPSKVLSTTIPRTVRIAEAPSFGMPVYYYEKNSKGAQAYLEAAKELIKRDKKR